MRCSSEVIHGIHRISLVDISRGIATIFMVAYHFCFDLNYYGFTHFNFNYDGFWLSFRATILSLFLGLVGVSLTLATIDGFKPRRYFSRLFWLAACAALVSFSSKLLFPDSWIFFGVLHFIFLAGIVGLACVRLHWVNLAAGVALIAIGLGVHHPFFDQPWAQWFGLMTYKPLTEDYVPFLPWFGVVLIGMFLGRRLVTSSTGKWLANWHGNTLPAKLLAFAGRNSLLIYMLHQPLLLGMLYGIRMVICTIL